MVSSHPPGPRLPWGPQAELSRLCSTQGKKAQERGQPGCPKHCPLLVASGSLGRDGTWKPKGWPGGCGQDFCLGGHSNGCDSIIRALDRAERGVRGEQALRTKRGGRMWLSAPLAVRTASMRLSRGLTNSPLCQDGVKSPGQLTRLQDLEMAFLTSSTLVFSVACQVEEGKKKSLNSG